MPKVPGTIAAFALTAMLALPGSANAAERRADGIRAKDATAMTDVSARGYYQTYVGNWGGYRGHWGPRRAWGYRAFWRRYAWSHPYWRPWYAGNYDAPYYAGPYYQPYPVVSFGFGPRWWW